MWNITPDVVELAREELKGRRAAIQARYDDEIQKLAAELDEIEALERVATAFAQRHKREEASASVEGDPIAPLEALPIAQEPAAEAEGIDHLNPEPEMEILSGAAVPLIGADANETQKVSGRWRMRS